MDGQMQQTGVKKTNDIVLIVRLWYYLLSIIQEKCQEHHIRRYFIVVYCYQTVMYIILNLLLFDLK